LARLSFFAIAFTAAGNNASVAPDKTEPVINRLLNGSGCDLTFSPLICEYSTADSGQTARQSKQPTHRDASIVLLPASMQFALQIFSHLRHEVHVSGLIRTLKNDHRLIIPRSVPTGQIALQYNLPRQKAKNTTAAKKTKVTIKTVKDINGKGSGQSR
jgi:hypothetical protein